MPKEAQVSEGTSADFTSPSLPIVFASACLKPNVFLKHLHAFAKNKTKRTNPGSQKTPYKTSNPLTLPKDPDVKISQ